MTCFLGKHLWESAYYCIHLCARHRFPILADVKSLAIDGICYLIGSHTTISLYHHVNYGFFYLHLSAKRILKVLLVHQQQQLQRASR